MKTQDRTQTKVVTKGHAHPTMRTFTSIGLILFLITAIEFGIVYIEGIRGTIVTILFLLSAIKFYLVAAVFMHLKFENRFLGWVFAVGVVLGGLILLSLKYVNMA